MAPLVKGRLMCPGGVAGETAGAGDVRPGAAVIWRDDPLAIPISTTSSSSKGVRTLRVEAGDEGALAAVDIEPHYQGARWLSVQELEDSWGDRVPTGAASGVHQPSADHGGAGGGTG